MSSSTEETRAIVTRYVQALVDGDVEILRASFAPDATWTFPGDLPVSGTWTGPDDIIDGFLAGVVARLDPTVPVEVTPRGILADGDRALAEWTSRARSKDGQQYKNDYAVVFASRPERLSTCASTWTRCMPAGCCSRAPGTARPAGQSSRQRRER